MAYSLTAPLARIAGELTGGPTLWAYTSTADAKATIMAAGYVSNAVQLGVKVGDLLLISDIGTPQATLAIASVVGSTTTTWIST